MTRREDVLGMLQKARRQLPIGTALIHKKGGVYRVIGHSFDTETEEISVAYRRIGGPNYDPIYEGAITFTRPLSLFTEDRFREIR